MTCLRVLPNKYPIEEKIWFSFMMGKYNDFPIQENNQNIKLYLNKIFGTTFEGGASGDIKFTDYPLPLLDLEEYNHELATRTLKGYM